MRKKETILDWNQLMNGPEYHAKESDLHSAGDTDLLRIFIWRREISPSEVNFNLITDEAV